MYERSAIILERYYNNIFGFDKKDNLKTIYKDYKNMIEEIKKYQSILAEEDKVINEFDSVANQIRKIQQEQKKIYKLNIKSEEERNQLFDSLDEEPNSIEKKLKIVEEKIDINNKRLEELREEFVNALIEFSQKQEARNRCSRNRRTEEKEYLQIIEKSNNTIKNIDEDVLKNMRAFTKSEDEDENKKQEITELMVDNGKDERIPFNKEVINCAVKVRNTIAKKEAECYITIYDKTKRILTEIGNDDINIDKYNKTLRDISVKLAFLKAQKMYIVSFLDNERMTAINGLKIHKKLMSESCEQFELDMEQFNNLYELILREVSGRSTKKAYKELYNKEYLKNIQEKEKSIEKEMSSIKINGGAIINSNYWRIEEIKNIYEVFKKEINQKFGKDLSELQLEENEKVNDNMLESEEKNYDIEDDIFKKKISDDDVEYVEEYEYEDDDEYEDDEEYEDDDEYDDDEEYEDDDEYDDEEYVDDEFEDNNDKSKESKKGKGLFNKFFRDK